MIPLFKSNGSYTVSTFVSHLCYRRILFLILPKQCKAQAVAVLLSDIDRLLLSHCIRSFRISGNELNNLGFV